MSIGVKSNAFQTNSRNIIGRNPSMVIPLLANQDLTPMLALWYRNVDTEAIIYVNLRIETHGMHRKQDISLGCNKR